MLKKSLWTAVCLLIVLSFSACGKKDAGTEGVNTATEAPAAATEAPAAATEAPAAATQEPEAQEEAAQGAGATQDAGEGTEPSAAPEATDTPEETPASEEPASDKEKEKTGEEKKEQKEEVGQPAASSEEEVPAKIAENVNPDKEVSSQVVYDKLVKTKKWMDQDGAVITIGKNGSYSRVTEDNCSSSGTYVVLDDPDLGTVLSIDFGGGTPTRYSLSKMKGNTLTFIDVDFGFEVTMDPK